MTNNKEELLEYPILIDSGMDLAATEEFIGTASAIYQIAHYTIAPDRKIVYMDQQKEGKEIVDAPSGLRRKFERNLIVAGYLVKPTGFFKFLKSDKIRVVPEEERNEIESKLLDMVKNENQTEVKNINFG